MFLPVVLLLFTSLAYCQTPAATPATTPSPTGFSGFKEGEDYVIVTDLISKTHTVLKNQPGETCGSECFEQQSFYQACGTSGLIKDQSCLCSNGYATALRKCKTCQVDSGEKYVLTFLPDQVASECERLSRGDQTTQDGQRPDATSNGARSTGTVDSNAQDISSASGSSGPGGSSGSGGEKMNVRFGIAVIAIGFCGLWVL